MAIQCFLVADVASEKGKDECVLINDVTKEDNNLSFPLPYLTSSYVTFIPSLPFIVQKKSFEMYTEYIKNKPQSDALMASHGNEFFKV